MASPRLPHCPSERPLSPPAPTAYLLLDVAGLACALPREAVREILPLPHLHRPPTGDGLLAGFLNLGGTPIPVVDLARLLGLRTGDAEPDPYRHVLLSAGGGEAFLVDRVRDLVAAEASATRPVAPDRTLNGCVVAEWSRGADLVHVLSLERLLSVEERQRLSALAAAATERLSALGPA